MMQQVLAGSTVKQRNMQRKRNLKKLRKWIIFTSKDHNQPMCVLMKGGIFLLVLLDVMEAGLLSESDLRGYGIEKTIFLRHLLAMKKAPVEPNLPPPGLLLLLLLMLLCFYFFQIPQRSPFFDNS